MVTEESTLVLITPYITWEQHEKIKLITSTNRLTKSEIIREALDMYFASIAQ